MTADFTGIFLIEKKENLHAINSAFCALNADLIRQGKQGLHGDIYKLLLLMQFLKRGLDCGYSFMLSSDIKEKEIQFNDLYFEINEHNGKKYRLLKAKHKADEKEKITFRKLLETDEGDDFNFGKYFFSYLECKNQKLFKNGKIIDVTICSNIDFAKEDTIQRHGHTYEIGNIIEPITGPDKILDVKENTSSKVAARYRFKNEILDLLKLSLEEYKLKKLASKVLDAILTSKDIRDHDPNIKLYHVVLADKVFYQKKAFCESFISGKDLDEYTKMFRKAVVADLRKIIFHEDFIKGKELDDHGKIFRPILKDDIIKINASHPSRNNQDSEEFEKYVIEQMKEMSKNDETILTYLNQEMVKKANKKINLKVSKKFGEGPSKEWPRDTVKDEDINDFLGCLVFAVNQPNVHDLGEIIKTFIQEEANADKTNSVYHKIFVHMLDWINGEGKEFISNEDGQKYFNEFKNYWFCVRTPQNDLTGKEKEFNNLRELIQNNCESSQEPKVVIVYGPKGTGKSILANHYVLKYSAEYNNNIVWFDATDHSTLLERVREFAFYKLDMQKELDEFDDIQRILQKVYNSIRKRSPQEIILMVFDNAANEYTAPSGDIISICNLLSTDIKFIFLITITTDAKDFQQWQGNIKTMLVETFSENEAIAFVNKHIENLDGIEDFYVLKLIEKLQYSPSALKDAVNYINARRKKLQYLGQNYNIKKYLDETTSLNSYYEI